MPGADEDDLAHEEPLDLNFMEATDEEKAEEARLQAEKDSLKAEEEAAAQKAAEDKAKADEAAEEEAAKEEAPKEEAPKAEDEQKLAEEVEKAREDKAKKQPMVPKKRLDEVLAKNKELAAQLTAANAAREAATKKTEGDAFDFDAKEAEYMQLVLNGETDKALAVRRSIREAEKAQLTVETRTATGKDSEAVALANAAAEVVKAFPQFLEGTAEYNAEATARVVKMRDALMSSGTNAVEALNEAVEFVVNKYGFDASPEPAVDTKVVNLDEKRKQDTAKKVDTQRKQPPEIKGEGERTRVQSKTAVDVMSQEEWDALPEATRKRLRGDDF